MAQLESGKPHSLKEIFCGENDKIIVSLENLKKYILIKIQIRIIKQIIAMDTLGLHQMEVFNLQ